MKELLFVMGMLVICIGYNSQAPSGMVWVKGGEIMMGCNGIHMFDCIYLEERPAHKVKVNDFFMDEHEVTNKEYADFLNDYYKSGENSDKKKLRELIKHPDFGLEKRYTLWFSKPGKEDHPVVWITWYGANEFALFYGKRLPTEAEFEFAAKGKTAKLNEALLNEIAWHQRNSDDILHPIKQKKANGYGLYDLLGNVYEWTNSTWGPYPGGKIDEINKCESCYVIRGGSYKEDYGKSRPTFRHGQPPQNSFKDLGFRCVKDK